MNQPPEFAAQPLAGSNLWAQPREILEVQRLLLPGETLLLVTNAKVLRRARISRTWLIALTQHRLLCMRGHRAVNRRQIEMSTARIDAAYIKRDISGREVRIETDSGKLRLGGIPPETAEALVTMLVRLRHTGGQHAAGQHAAGHHPPALPYHTPAPGSMNGGALPAAGGSHASMDRIESLELTVERLETELAKMHEHLQFLELLLQKRATGVETVSSQRSDGGYAT